MGEPIVNNIFDKNRWDYAYYRKRDPEQTILSMVSIFFEEEKVIGMKRIVRNNDGLFDVQADSSEFPEFIEDEKTAAVKKEIFEDIKLEGIKDDDILAEEFLTKAQLDNLEEKNIVQKDVQEEVVIEKKVSDESINASNPEDDKINNVSAEMGNKDNVNRKNDNDIVSDIIKGWLESWQSKNIEEYFSYYQEDFTPNSFDNNELWIKDRSRKILGKSAIKIDIKDLSITFDIDEGEKAITEFTQYYKSASYSDVVTKTVVLKKFEDQWKIISEDITQ
jgi:ketosteroid isomerase-like protein